MTFRKLSTGQKLVVASHNPGKVKEINALVGPYGMDAVSAGELNIPEPVEDGDTFAANAKIKARACAKFADLPALSDDSGLEVEALDGAPGIYSARWGGPDKDFNMAMQKVHEELIAIGAETQAQRKANFTCALCLAWPDGHTEVFEGKVFGHIVWPMRGDKGFGYDPFFVPEGDLRTFGEFDPDEKHAISHRAEAFRLFKAACLDVNR